MGTKESDKRIGPNLKSGCERILFVDDEELLRSVVPKMLRAIGYSAECASSGPETVDEYRKAMDAGNPFDVVIIDLTVKGGISGEEAVKRLLEIDPEARVIVSSGYPNAPVMVNYRDYGFIGAIVKPYTSAELKDLIVEVLGS